MIKSAMVPTRPAKATVFESTTKLVLCNQEDRLMVEDGLELERKTRFKHLWQSRADDGQRKEWKPPNLVVCGVYA
jgi:hypothetical protein